MNLPLFGALLLLLPLILGAVFLVVLKRRRSKKSVTANREIIVGRDERGLAPAELKPAEALPVAVAPPSSYVLREFHPIALFQASRFTLDGQSEEWRAHMHALGARMHAHRVCRVFFVHGSFVGEDPFDVISLVKDRIPHATKLLNHRLMHHLAERKEAFVGDLGNFTPDYAQLAEAALGHSIQALRFTWSSGNHHLARLLGAIQLLTLLTASPLASEERLLLIGHSHAGQLFAILTELLAGRERARSLLGIAERCGLSPEQVQLQLTRLTQVPIDFVTLGTPPRYSWALMPHQRLLHIVNHRGQQPEGGTLSGLFNTRDGDYIQQWGVAGSDGLCPIKLHAELNRELVPLLGAGLNLALWQEEIKKRRRLAASGHTLLVDYKDNGKSINCFGTLFGHGTYTRYNTMLYNLSEIADYFY